MQSKILANSSNQLLGIQPISQSHHANSFSIPTRVRELITQNRSLEPIGNTLDLFLKNILNNLALSFKRMLNKIRNDPFNIWTSSLTAKGWSFWRVNRNLKQKNT